MPSRCASCLWLTGLWITALCGEEKKSWPTACVSLFLANQNAAAQCVPGVELSIPSADEVRQGRLPALTFRTRDPRFAVVRFELNKGKAAGEALDLEISRVNETVNPPGMNCRFLPPGSMNNRAAVSLTCASPQVILGHVLRQDEASAAQFFEQAVAVHNLLSPGKPFPRAAGSAPASAPASASAAGPARAVAAYQLEGQCRLLRFNGLDLTSTCRPLLTLQVPNAVAASQGETLRLMLPPNGGPAVWIYLGGSQPQADGTVRWQVTGVNSTRADASSACVVARTELHCRGTAGGSDSVFALSYALTGDPAQFAALRVGARPAPASAAGAAAGPAAPAAKTVLSSDPKAIYGLLAGAPKPALATCLDEENLPPDVPLCRSQAGAALAELFGALKQQDGDYEKMGLTVISVFVNRRIFDTKFTDNVLLYVDGANIIQRIKLSTGLAAERDVMSMLTQKYGAPAKQTSTTWTNPQTGALISRTPNFFWSFPTLMVDYFTRDSTVLNKLSTAGGIDVYTPAYLRLVEADQKRRGAPVPGKKGI